MSISIKATELTKVRFTIQSNENVEQQQKHGNSKKSKRETRASNCAANQIWFPCTLLKFYACIWEENLLMLM